MSTMRRLRGLVLVAGVVPLLSGCLVVSALNARQVTGAGVATPVTTAVGAPTTATPSAHPSTSSSSTLASTPSPTPSPSSPPPALPAGSAWATVDSEQLRFAVPAAWAKIVPDEMSTAATIPADVKAVAKALGISSTELVKRFDFAELAYVAAPVSRYSTNLSMTIADIGSLPDDEWVQNIYAQGKVKVVGTERVTTLVGPALRINGTVTVQGIAISLTTLIVDVGRDCFVVDVAARKRAEVDTTISTLLATLHSV